MTQFVSSDLSLRPCHLPGGGVGAGGAGHKEGACSGVSEVLVEAGAGGDWIRPAGPHWPLAGPEREMRRVVSGGGLWGRCSQGAQAALSSGYSQMTQGRAPEHARACPRSLDGQALGGE